MKWKIGDTVNVLKCCGRKNDIGTIIRIARVKWRQPRYLIKLADGSETLCRYHQLKKVNI